MSLSALVFLVAFAAGSLAALLRHPVYGLMTYIAVFYVHPPSRWWGQGWLLDIRWSLLAACVAVLAVVIRKPTGNTAPLFRSWALWVFVVFIAWIALQSLWAKDPDAHAEQLSIYLKFIVVMFLFCRVIDSERTLRMVLWTHVLGCAYFGWIVFTTYTGGRFEEFGGPGLGDANAAALQLVTGIFVAGSLLLVGTWQERGALLALIPLVVNAMVATISRSGFLAAAIGGVVYNAFAPAKHRFIVGFLSGLALLLFVLLTNQEYWLRIDTVKHRGQEVVGVDTGGGRLVILDAQWRMVKAHPLGCGHGCTTVLSPSYLDERYLSEGGRASHNTFMTMLVDQGIPGGAFYLAMAVWTFAALRTVRRRLRGSVGALPSALAAVAASLVAIFVGDQFVQYPKFEARVWFISLIIVLLHMSRSRGQSDQSV